MTIKKTPRLTLAEARAKKSWLAVAEHYADQDHARHLTILKFANGWKAVFGTPKLSDWDPDSYYGPVLGLRHAPSAEYACQDLLLREKYIGRDTATGVDFSEPDGVWRGYP